MPTHGKASTYRRGCKCTPCRQAHATRTRAERAKRKQMVENNPDVVEHGRASTYANWGCTCQLCRDAAAAAQAARRES